MTVQLLGVRRHVKRLYDLDLKVAGEDFGVGMISGMITSWPNLQPGEVCLIGVNHTSMTTSFYSVETLEDVNSLRERMDDILDGRLRIYVATRKHPINLGKIED